MKRARDSIPRQPEHKAQVTDHAACPVCAAHTQEDQLLQASRLDEILALEAYRPNLRAQMLAVFDACARDSLQDCRQAYRCGDQAALVHAAHRLMGSAASLGAERLRRLAAETETCAQAQADNLALADLLERLAATLDDTLCAYRHWLVLER